MKSESPPNPLWWGREQMHIHLLLLNLPPCIGRDVITCPLTMWLIALNSFSMSSLSCLFSRLKKKISAYLVAPHLKTILYSSVFLLFLIFTVSSPGVIHYSSIEHRLMYKYKCVFWFASHLFYYIRHLPSWAPPRIRVILQRKSLLNGPLFPRVKSRLLYSWASSHQSQLFTQSFTCYIITLWRVKTLL